MSIEGKHDSMAIVAGEDMNTEMFQYHAIALDDGKVAANGLEAIGILKGKPKSGDHAQVAYKGRIKYRAGGAITIGTRVKVASSGWIVSAGAAAGSGFYSVGRALSTVTSGSIGDGLFDFTNPVYRVSSL